MKRSLRVLLVAPGAVTLLCAAAAIANPDAPAAPPAMTAEQKAEMEAYIKAGTPGAPHQALAATAGNYDLKLKSWHEAGAPPMEGVYIPPEEPTTPKSPAAPQGPTNPQRK